MIQIYESDKEGVKVEIKERTFTFTIKYPVLVKYLTHFEYFVHMSKNLGRTNMDQIKRVYDSEFKPQQP